MIGRAAYQDSWLARAARRAIVRRRTGAPRPTVLAAFERYVARELASGTPLRAMTRHLLGMRSGRAGGRRWRRELGRARRRRRAASTICARSSTRSRGHGAVAAWLSAFARTTASASLQQRHRRQDGGVPHSSERFAAPDCRFEVNDVVATAKKKFSVTMAEKADIHDLYERSVQAVDVEAEFLRDTYRALRGREALSLREDFCGTASLACEWVRTGPRAARHRRRHRCRRARVGAAESCRAIAARRLVRGSSS